VAGERPAADLIRRGSAVAHLIGPPWQRFSK
jgi:hypothetical protein